MDVPPVIVAPAQRRGWWPVLAALGAAGIALVLFLFNPSQHAFYPRCMLYVMTGLYCPGCGVLRASHQLLHGHLLTALHYNVLYVLSLPFAAFYSLRRTVSWMNGRPAPPLTLLQPKWLVAGAVVLFLFTVLRNIPIAPFTLLAPPH